MIADQGKILVAKAKGSNLTFLPGGHIEWGEKAGDAQARGLVEELGVKATIGAYLGAVEHRWEEEEVHFEINHVFDVEIPNLSSDNQPVSQEGYLKFFWLSPGELTSRNLRPSPLVELISNKTAYSNAFWASTL